MKHRHTIEEKLKDVFSDGNTEADIKLEIMRTKCIKKRVQFKKSTKTKQSRRTHVCPVCDKIFRESFHSNQHQSFEHPELFFESSNLFWESQNKLNLKNLVENFLVQETRNKFTKIEAMTAIE